METPGQDRKIDFSYGTGRIFPFLSSLGPAPDLKAFRLRDEDQDSMDDNRHRRGHGCLPSFHKLHLTVTMTWPADSFKDLRLPEFCSDAHELFNPTLVLEVLRESPLLENLYLVGNRDHFDEEPPAVALPSLRNCTLTGVGAIFLIWHMDIPASTNVSLDTPPSIGNSIHPARDLSLGIVLRLKFNCINSNIEGNGGNLVEDVERVCQPRGLLSRNPGKWVEYLLRLVKRILRRVPPEIPYPEDIFPPNRARCKSR